MIKKFFSVFTAILYTVSLLTSCSQNKIHSPTASEYISDEPLPLTGVQLDYKPSSLAAYKNIAFILSDSKLSRFDILSGDTAVILDNTDALAVGCDSASFAVVSPSDVTAYDHSGELLKKISTDINLSEVSDIAIFGSSIAFADTSKPSNIYFVDLSSNKLKLLPDTWKMGSKDATVQKLSFTDDGTLRISNKLNFGYAGSDFRVLEYDIEGDEIVSSYDATETAYNGCFGTDGDFYYVENYTSGFGTDLSWKQFVSKLSRDGVSSNVMIVDNEEFKKLGIEPKNVYTHDIVDEHDYLFTTVLDEYSFEYSDGESFVVWNQTAGTLEAFNSGSRLDALLLLVPDTSSWFLKDLIVDYTAKTGRQVIMSTQPDEEYSDRLRTKLLAGDSDFDLFISDAVLLRSILENSAYQPLDGYENLSANFDSVLAEGIRELMTAEHGLFGVPMSFSFWGCLKQAGDYKVPRDWTDKELFETCEQLPNGYKLFNDRFMLTRTVVNYVEDMIQKDGEINKDELSDFLGKLKSYNDKGVLCDGDADAVMTYGMVFFTASELKINDVDSSEINISPTRSGTKYIGLQSTMMMNQASKNKDAAAEFLTMMTSLGYVYTNEGFCPLIGRDIKKNTCYESLTDFQRAALEYSLTVYKNSKPATLAVDEEFTQFVASAVVEALFDGELNASDAAQKIIDEVSYTYFE